MDRWNRETQVKECKAERNRFGKNVLIVKRTDKTSQAIIGEWCIRNDDVVLALTCDALRDLVPFVQFKKRGNTHGGVLILAKLQASAWRIDTFRWFGVLELLC